MPGPNNYIEPAEFANLLWQAMRSDANPSQRDEAALAVANYMGDVLKRLDDLEEQFSNAPAPFDIRNLRIGYEP